MPDRLQALLNRALHRAAVVKTAKAKLREKSEAERIAEDYGRRLAEKHLYRQLLNDERMDGLRFRWYFTHIEKSTGLDELRNWIDSKIAQEG